MFSDYIIPGIMLIIIVYALIKGTPVFSAFTDGAKEGLKNMYAIAPSLIGLVTAVGMLKASGAADLITTLAEPITSLLGIPKATAPFFLLKPVSGSGSFAMLNSIIEEHGADSLIAKAAAVMTGSTETTFYCIAVYFGATKIKKTGCTIQCAMLADFASMLTACLAVVYHIF